jgi:flagellar basal-body rod protein FlgB
MLDPVANRLENYLDLLSARQKLVSGNIANADTPGFKTQDLDFRTTLENMLDGAPSRAAEVEGLPSKSDGNNVNLDRESRLLAENAIRFNLASNLLRAQIRVVRSAIQEGRTG